MEPGWSVLLLISLFWLIQEGSVVYFSDFYMLTGTTCSCSPDVLYLACIFGGLDFCKWY